jgi:hypothetical protein
MHPLLSKLSGGDRRSIGKADEVVGEVIENPALLRVVFEGMLLDDPVVRMRCADVAEKITAKHPDYLQPYKEMLIQQLSGIEQQEVRWHVAQMLPRLNLNVDERTHVFSILAGFLNDKSKIVRTFSLQSMADLAEDEKHLRKQLIPILKESINNGSPSMKSRARRLLEKLTE